MKSFFIKQKFWDIKDSLNVYDVNEEPMYAIKGSLDPIRKTYTLLDGEEQVAVIDRDKSLVPSFTVTIGQQYSFTVQRKLASIKPRYIVEGEGIEVTGDFLGMDFKIIHKGNEIGAVHKEWIALTDTYQIDVYEDMWEVVIIALVIAIDRVKEERNMITSIFDFLP